MLRFRVSATLLLAATCLLMMKTVFGTERVTTCGGVENVHRLSCDTGVIVVKDALYGRRDSETCIEGRPHSQISNTHCSMDGTLDIIKLSCDGKTECELNPRVLSKDPCVGTAKYLETTYDCFPAINFDTCEGSLAHLQCDEGTIIYIYGANYGRHDHTTCSYNRPTSQLQRIDCSDHSRKVANICNGKNSCTISATNSEFGDPCDGTYKYLEVAYTCILQPEQLPNN
ncbi:L-rhamnose-binding lectin SML [Dissostichus eleginoides]|uniref:L-rhamnose-binding lectin SML n=1 Tax=Dissostichus eleginoides TaxID=100907 RepID=A0AAD9C9G7_DISEL|nr:L-rhamnose-binding lectin SML [Dissostichus eleginoides]